MLETTTTRHNRRIDRIMAVWSWEIPLYLFVGGVVAGMMVLGGLAMLRVARGQDSRNFFSLQTPLQRVNEHETNCISTRRAHAVCRGHLPARP